MADYIEVSKRLRDLAALTGSLHEILTIVDKHNNLAQIEADHASRVAKAKSEHDSAVKGVAEAKKSAHAAHEACKAAATEAAAKAAKLIADAEEKAKAITAAAAAEHDKLVKEASVKVAAAEAAAKAALATKDKAEAATAAAQSQLDAIRTAIAAATKV